MDKSSPAAWLDRLLVWWFDLKPQYEIEYERARKEEHIPQIEHILKDMGIIDSKSSALLTHVSIMIAVAFGLTSLQDINSIIKIFLYFEAFAYIVVALLLMRCVDIMGPPFRTVEYNDSAIKENYLNEILIRRSVYQLAVRAVIWLTIVLGLVLATESIFWVSGNGANTACE